MRYVKNRNSCVTAVEGINKIVTGNLETFSEHELIDGQSVTQLTTMVAMVVSWIMLLSRSQEQRCSQGRGLSLLHGRRNLLEAKGFYVTAKKGLIGHTNSLCF